MRNITTKSLKTLATNLSHSEDPQLVEDRLHYLAKEAGIADTGSLTAAEQLLLTNRYVELHRGGTVSKRDAADTDYFAADRASEEQATQIQRVYSALEQLKAEVANPALNNLPGAPRLREAVSEAHQKVVALATRNFVAVYS